MSLYDGKTDTDAKYIITGNTCELTSKGEIKKTGCIAVHYEIQDLRPDLGSGLVIGSQSSQTDFSLSAPFWGIAFTSVLFLWLFSHGIGHILKLVKNA
ncbi:hypothetical protein RHO13_13195 (plasmid) [Orbus wheelerorum]|uniref:hypothetical protein n=1 Tax=Orbus wheelerorum TaxID=3074111 RepID=UPI00370D983D